MAMYDNFLFDLDGTLTDPYEGITNSVAYALEKFGFSVADKRELIKFIGPPLTESFSEFYGLSDSDALLAVKHYREYFSDKGIYENKVYDGVYDVLRQLKANGKRLVIATSKPEPFTERILEYFDLKKYFDFVAGATFDFARVKKSDVIAYAMQNCKFISTEDSVMIGDRKHDVLGAKSNGLRVAGVLYGYGDRAELAAAGADYILNCPADILELMRI